MTEGLQLAGAWLAGVLLGALFFGGLWWTVRRSLSSPRPALWTLGSLLLRTAVTLGGFYALAQGPWQRLLLGLVGFVMARWLVVWLVGPVAAPPTHATGQARHAT